MHRALYMLALAATAFVLAGVAFVATRSTTSDGALPPPSAVGMPISAPAPAASPSTAVWDLTVAVDDLTHAPSGRTGGIPAVDALLDGIVGTAPAVIEALGAVPWEGNDDCRSVTPRTLDAQAMALAFAEARPPLHSAFTPSRSDDSAPRDAYSVVLGRGHRAGGATTGRAWRIDVRGDRIIAAATHCDFADLAFEPPIGEIERYLLLPPEADLPPPVPLHAAQPVTGRAALDAIVREALAGDGAALARRVRAGDHLCSTSEVPALAAPPCGAGDADGTVARAVAVHECGRVRFEALEWARDTVASLLAAPPPSLHAIVALPAGYVPAGDALVLLSWETRRYNWASAGLVVADDAISGLVLGCGTGRPEWLYPPTVVAGPFPGAVDGSGPTWSGIGAIDRVIVALSNGDEARIGELLDPVLIGCVAESMAISSPPLCLEGEAPGTLVPVLPVTDCDVAYIRAQDFDDLVATLARIAPRLYAVTAPPRGFADLWQLADYTLLVLDTAADSPAAAFPTIAVSASGIAGFASGCEASLTANLLRPSPAPQFLVGPPR